MRFSVLRLQGPGSALLNIISVCKSLSCSFNSLVLQLSPEARFVISSEMFTAETCFLPCGCAYPLCLFHVHASEVKLSVFEM